MGLLDRLGIQRHVAHRVAFAFESEIVFGKGATHDFDTFTETLAAFFTWNIKAGEFARDITLS
jgi:hypothetical protein